MTKDEALEIIFFSLQFRGLMESLEEPKKQLSPDEWKEVFRVLMDDVDKFVAKRMAELPEGNAGKTFRA